MAFTPQTFALKNDNTAKVEEVTIKENIWTRVTFTKPSAESTETWSKMIASKFPNDWVTNFAQTTGELSISGAHGQEICNLLSGHDKGEDRGDNEPPPSEGGPGNPQGGNPTKPYVPGDRNDEERYRTMTGVTGRTPILPRGK